MSTDKNQYGWPLCAIIAGLSCQFALMIHLFPGFSLLVHPQPLFLFDYPLLEYQIDSARSFWACHHRLWGYDSSFLGGFVDPFLWNSNAILQVLAVLLPFLKAWHITIYFPALVIAATPPLIFFSFRWIGLGVPAATGGMVVTVVGCLLGIGIIFLSIGMPTAFLVGTVCLAGYASFYKWVSNNRVFHGGLLLLPLALLVHKTAAILLAGPLLVLLFLHIDCMNKRKWGVLLALALATITVNFFWLVPAISFRDLVDFSFNNFFKDIHVLITLEWDNLRDFAGLYLYRGCLLALGGIGLVHLWKCGRRRLAVSLGFNVVYFVLIILLGGLLPGFHAARYEFNWMLFLSLVAGFGLQTLLPSKMPIREKAIRGILLALIITGCILLGGYNNWFTFQKDDRLGLSNEKIQQFSSLPVEALKDVSSYLKGQDDDSRVFLEHSRNTRHMEYMVQKWSGKQFISGAYNFIFVKQNYINFEFQHLLSSGFSKMVHDMGLGYKQSVSPSAFLDLVEKYNVSWFVVSDDALLKELAGRQGIRFEEKAFFPPFRVYHLERASSYFYKGSGICHPSSCGLVLSEVKADPDTGAAILKYHWVDQLQASNGLVLRPVNIPGLQWPFVGILNPPSEFSIFLK